MNSPFTRLVLALIVLVAALGSYGSWYAVVAAKSAAVANLQNQITTKMEAANRITLARATLADITTSEAAVQNYFIPESGAVAFINDLEARGRAQGATVHVLSVSDSTMGTHTALSLSLHIVGTFGTVMRTVGSIEYAPYDLTVGSLVLGLDAKHLWHADLTLVVGTISVMSATSTAVSTNTISPTIPASSSGG